MLTWKGLFTKDSWSSEMIKNSKHFQNFQKPSRTPILRTHAKFGEFIYGKYLLKIQGKADLTLLKELALKISPIKGLVGTCFKTKAKFPTNMYQITRKVVQDDILFLLNSLSSIIFLLGKSYIWSLVFLVIGLLIILVCVIDQLMGEWSKPSFTFSCLR